MLPLALLLTTVAAEPAALSELKDAEPSKVRLAIMAVSAQGVPPEYTAGVTETIATEIARTGVFDTISPAQVSSILAYEQRKDALGGCVSEDCYVQVARLVKAEHLIGGAVAKVGELLVLNLILIDASDGKAINRARHETPNPSELVRESHRAAITLLQPLLSQRQGYLRIAANVPDAAVIVDDVQRAEGVGQVIALPAGPHTLRLKKDGFYGTAADVLIHPGQVETQRISLIPARETIEAYESKASFMRTTAWISGGLAVGAGLLAGVLYANASGDKDVVDRFASMSDIDRSRQGLREEALSAKDSFEVKQGIYLGAIGGALLFGATSLYFFLAGDDPDRYEEFRSLEK